MTKKKDKHKQQANHSQMGKGVKWDLVWKILASVFAFAGSLATVYDLVGKVRSDAQTFFGFVIPGLAAIVWLTVLVQLIRKKNPYVILLLAFTVIGGIVGGIGWQSYNRTQEDKVIVLVARFDGPEEKYGVGDELIENLKKATKDHPNIEIAGTETIVNATQGSEYARAIGKKELADIVIWAWYRPTDNPNITIHIENLSLNEISFISESEIYQPSATLADLESFEIQRQIGTQTVNLIDFLAGYLQYQADNEEAALDLFNKVLNSGENIPVVNQEYLFFYTGNCYVGLGGYNAAIQQYDTVLQLNPDDVYAYTSRGFSYHQLDNDKQAIQDYSKAIELDPYFIYAYGNRAVSYIAGGQYELAIQDYDKAVQLNPNYAGVYSNRGYSYAQLGQHELAIQDYARAIQLNPNDANAFNNRGYSYAQLGQHERAIQDYSNAIQRDPIIYAYINRGASYDQISQHKLAMQDYDKAIQLSPSLPNAYSNRGYSFFLVGEYNLALQDMNQAIELDPSYASAYLGRATIYQQLGKVAEAEADFKKYEELTGEKP